MKKPKPSRTKQALELVEKGGLTVHQAADKVGITANAIYRAQARRKGKRICEHCGQVIRGG